VSTSLSSLLLASAGPELSRALESREDLEATLSRIASTAHAAWPDVEMDDAVFIAHLARHLARQADPARSLAATRAADLYLACACASGDAAALRAFERTHLSQVPLFVAHLGLSPVMVDELVQGLRTKLLVRGEDALPKIADYTGCGALGGWVRVAAVRTALNLRRDDDPPQPSTDEHKAVAAEIDPELDFLKVRYRAEFRAAFYETLRNLGIDERNVLRFHYMDGLTIDEIGAAYGVHRATVARWLARAREDVLEKTRRALSERLKVDTQEAASVIALIQSRLEVSLARLLAETPRPTD
jgi:RNA polymerase sigma-70 factor (ECF subfamily)